MIKRWVYVALAFGLGMSAMSCENQKFNDVKVDVDRVHVDGREKSVRITWNAICRCRKTEWYWHYMTIT